MTDTFTDKPEISDSVLSAADFLNSGHLDDFIAKLSSGDTIVTEDGLEIPMDEWVAVTARPDSTDPLVPTLQGIDIACMEIVQAKADIVANEVAYTFGERKKPPVIQPTLSRARHRQAVKFIGQPVRNPRVLISRGEPSNSIPNFDDRRIPRGSIITITVAGDADAGIINRRGSYFIECAGDNPEKPALFVWRTREKVPSFKS